MVSNVEMLSGTRNAVSGMAMKWKFEELNFKLVETPHVIDNNNNNNNNLINANTKIDYIK